MSLADDYKKEYDKAASTKPADAVVKGDPLAIVLSTGGCSILKPSLDAVEALALADWLILNFK